MLVGVAVRVEVLVGVLVGVGVGVPVGVVVGVGVSVGIATVTIVEVILFHSSLSTMAPLIVSPESAQA